MNWNELYMFDMIVSYLGEDVALLLTFVHSLGRGASGNPGHFGLINQNNQLKEKQSCVVPKESFCNAYPAAAY